MKKGLLLLSILFTIIISCNAKSNEREKEIEPVNNEKEIKDKEVEEIEVQNLNDSLLIGYPKVSDENFVNKLGLDFEHFHMYESILKTMNKKYMPFTNDKVIKEEKVGDIVLKLINKQIKKSDIEIELSIYKDDKKIDSILFYRYQWDKNAPDGLQRRELLSHIDDGFYLWHLKTFTNHSEDAVGIEKWERHKIDTKTGKIKFIKEMYFPERQPREE